MSHIVSYIWVLKDKLIDKIYNLTIIPTVNREDKSRENDSVFSKIYTHFYNLSAPPTEIIDNIYLGNGYNAADLNTLQINNIQYIINATNEIPNYYDADVSKNITYMKIPISDIAGSSIKDYLEQSYTFITQSNDIGTGNILIHCYMGSSRSAAVVIYYLMKMHNKTLDEAMVYIKSKRDIVNLNTCFIEDLQSL